jgi:hypothetical protein
MSPNKVAVANRVTLRRGDAARGCMVRGGPPCFRYGNCNRDRLPHLPRHGDYGLHAGA